MVTAEHGSWLWALAFDRDATRAFTGGANTLVRSWPTRADALAEAVCLGVAPRVGLGPDKWEEYVDPERVEPYQETCAANTGEGG